MQFQGFNLIGSAAVVFEPLYHAQEIAIIKFSSGCFCKAKSVSSSNISWLFLIKQLVHSRLYISNAREWNNCQLSS